MAKLKVLEVIRQGQIGGGESHLLDLIYFLDKEKIDPICLSFSDGEMISRLKQMGITCYVIDTQKPFDMGVQRQIVKLIQKENVQLVHAHGSRAASNVLYPVRELHLPFVYTVHGWSFHDDQSFLIKKLRGWSEKLICHYANQVICVSESNKNTGREVFGLKNAIVIENGVNLEKFNPDRSFKNMRQEFGFSDSDFIVGFIARCTKQKNPLVFLTALEKAHAKNPSIKGLFVGEGDMDEEVDAYIQQHQMSSYLYRSPFRTDVPDLLHSIDVYCLPSLWEGLSIALLEAMAMRKAIIATPTDGTKEVISHQKNGYIVSFDDVSALANAINAFHEDTSLMKRCSESARLFVSERFNAKRVADSVISVYSRIVSS
ncbi:MAG: glycosyltransferase [Prevotella sp.]|nr:glycosyltransferase [Prevotella sp.]